MWRPADIRLEMIDDLTEGSVVTLEVATPIGAILVMGEAVVAGRTITADGVHMHGVGRRQRRLRSRRAARHRGRSAGEDGL